MTKRLVGIILGLAVVVGAPWAAYIFRYDMLDWWQLRSYEPSSEITALADRTTMTEYGKRLFYVHKPELDDKQTFSVRCSGTEQTIVLGCYRRQEGIYILLVTDEKLAGAMEVTAAHEMLHAAYDRLSANEKSKLHALLEEERSKLTNERIKNTIKGYEDRDITSIHTEMHSIFGTEVRNLSPDLEAHYARYFNDRSSVVAISEKYEQVFVDIKTKVEAYDADIAIRKKAIEVQEESIKATSEDLQNRKAQMDSLLADNNRETYNALVPSYNELVGTYNQMVNRLKSEIEQYNELVKVRNAISLEQQDLIKELDASATEVTR